PTPIAPDALMGSQAIGERLLKVAQQDLDLEPCPAEDDRLHPATQERLCTPLRLECRRAPDPKLAVDDRRGVKEQALRTRRGAFVIDQADRLTGASLTKLSGVGNGPRPRD